MGTDRIQPLTLICNYPQTKLYTLNVNLPGLKILDVEAGLDWTPLAAYNRGKMESVKGSRIHDRFTNLSKDYDMIIGNINVKYDRLQWAGDVGGKMILPPHGKDFLHSTVSTFLHCTVTSFLHCTVSTFLHGSVMSFYTPACGE